MMNEDNYRKAIDAALTPEYNNMLISPEEPHTFSPKFEKRMNKLIRRRKKPYYKIINTAGKRVAVIVGFFVIISFSTIMSVDALREAFKNFFVSIFEKFSIVRSSDESSSPDSIEAIYTITSGLGKYTISYQEQDEISNNTVYEDEDGHTIDFCQYVKSAYDTMINTENTVIESIDINGKEAMIYRDNHNYHIIIWDIGDYIITINSNIGKDELISIAKSVQKAEK